MADKLLKTIFVIIVLISSVCAVIYYSIRDGYHFDDFRCQSDVVVRKTYPSAEDAEIRMTSFFIFNNSGMATIIHKGIMTERGGGYLINRDYQVSVDKVAGTNIFNITNVKMTKTPEDLAPDFMLNEMVLGGTNFFSISQVNEQVTLIQGLVLPVMVCVDMYT
ncbi:MAG: hypothetical protein ACRDCA_17825 [Serratia sp. (in: enterobacteria)]|uniref:hypothetical protein n=1 Tax=Serratia sp. (in: enterobacteria) TaxID=616 RepID=UPI003F3DC37C